MTSTPPCPTRSCASSRASTNILLDTHVWLWLLAEPERFTPGGLARLRAPDTRLFLSAASTWEIAIKHSLGKLRLPTDGIDYVRTRLRQTPAQALPIQHEHALRVAQLPRHHRDPFDRMLVAQAQVEGLAIMSDDRNIPAYDVKIVGV